MLDQVRFSNFDAVITRGPRKWNEDASVEALRSSLFGLHESALLAEPENQPMADQTSPPDEYESELDDADNLEPEPEIQTMADLRSLPYEDEIDPDTDDLEPFPRFLVDPDWPAPAQKINFRPGLILQATAFVMSFGCVEAGATLLRQSLMAAKASVAAMRPVSSAEWVRSLPVEDTGTPNVEVKVHSGGASHVPLAPADDSEATPLSASSPVQMELPAMTPRRHSGVNSLQ